MIPAESMPVEPPIDSPRIVTPFAWTFRPGLRPPASISISTTASSPTASVFGLAPGWVKPSIVTPSASGGSSEPRAIVLSPPPGTAKWMASGPAVPLAAQIASRKLMRPSRPRQRRRRQAGTTAAVRVKRVGVRSDGDRRGPRDGWRQEQEERDGDEDGYDGGN